MIEWKVGESCVLGSTYKVSSPGSLIDPEKAPSIMAPWTLLPGTSTIYQDTVDSRYLDFDYLE